MKVEKHRQHGVCCYRCICREVSAVGLPGRLVVVVLIGVALLGALLGVRHLARTQGGLAVALDLSLPLPFIPKK